MYSVLLRTLVLPRLKAGPYIIVAQLQRGRPGTYIKYVLE